MYAVTLPHDICNEIWTKWIKKEEETDEYEKKKEETQENIKIV